MLSRFDDRMHEAAKKVSSEKVKEEDTCD